MGQIAGRCLCGSVSYTTDAEASFCAVCHCRHCQRETGSSFAIVVAVPAPELRITGALAQYDTTNDDSGSVSHRRFCPTCGSPVVGLSEALPGLALIKAGTLDDASWLEPQVEIWCGSAQPWLGEPHERPRVDRNPPLPGG